jgi:hypothetical protein
LATASNEELAGQPTPEPIREPSEQPFTYDEGEEPPVEPTEPIEAPEPVEPPEEPVTHDPLKDTQSKLTQTAQELAQTRKILEGVINAQQFGQPPPMAQPSAGPPLDTLLPEEQFTADPNFPARYMKRREEAAAQSRQEEESRRELVNFMGQNPGWQGYMPEMEQIKAEEPFVYDGYGALPRLYKRAQERRKLTEMEAKIKEAQGQGMRAGVQMGKQAGRTFTPPRGGTATASQQQRGKMPADFINWSLDKQREWLIANGLYRDE